ncbi:MAG: type II toxin-antitoxin system mRNA interferase toxin, RelE/StbE family [Candidatus Magasanikbacteria bacterium CG10_big_fil_rev_8_21_14_0_10_43_9]|nr:MAG: type II toxin-antitoxin system mRNA interferase toxin, RelE/StbE family [Candidatus Magasanikbacteria bacterium CG10_big_fil_rev_8_21_14_0_10_43_9]
MTILITKEFKKRYKKLSPSIQAKAEKQEQLFRTNPFHPSLHTEKLNPKKREVWSIRIDKKYRIIFRFIDGETILFLTVGPHDWIYNFT